MDIISNQGSRAAFPPSSELHHRLFHHPLCWQSALSPVSECLSEWIGKWVIVHRLLKVDGVENLDGSHASKGRCRTQSRCCLSGQSKDHRNCASGEGLASTKAKFTGTRTADNQNILISGIGRILRAIARSSTAPVSSGSHCPRTLVQ